MVLIVWWWGHMGIILIIRRLLMEICERILNFRFCFLLGLLFFSKLLNFFNFFLIFGL